MEVSMQKLTAVCVAIGLGGSMLLLSSCAPSDLQAIVANGTAATTSEKKFLPTHPARVKLYYGHVPTHYQVIGHVSADNYSLIGTPHTQIGIDEELKKQAASIGGKGVIHIQSVLDRTTGDVIRP